MKYSKQSKIGIKNEIEEGIELNDVDINPVILDLMKRETFAMFDEDNSGDIDKSELSKLIEVLGLEKNERKQMEIMREFDKDGNGTIDYEDFIKAMSHFHFGNAETHLETAFNEYDKDMDGEIGLDDLLKVNEELDQAPMSKADAQLMIAFFKYFSQENNEENVSDNEINNVNITKKEFINALKRVNFLVNKSEINQPQDMNKSKSGINNKSNLEKSNYEESKII